MQQESPVILIVDDNPINLELLFGIFESTSLTASYAKNGQRCLDIAAEKPPDLILLDIMMPGMDGFEVCRQLKASEQTRDIPVIFMTALADAMDKVNGLRLGAVDYITKPFQPEEVLARIETHLSIRRLQEELRRKNAQLANLLEGEAQLNRELQEALLREKDLNRIKTRFISVASHEIRSPLGLIGISATMLQRYGERLSEEGKQQYLHQIQHEVEHISEILNNVLFLSNNSANKFPFRPEMTDLKDFCGQLVEQFSMMSRETHTLTFSCLGEAFHYHVDQKLFHHILSNLISNAIKYSPDGGDILFTLMREPEELIVQVQDTGIGIPETDRPFLFETFRRGENVGNIKGVGLGLSIVKQFVELHGGRISIDSALNQGTTCIVRLPLNGLHVNSITP